MTVRFEFFLGNFLMDFFKGMALLLMYLMFIFSSRNQPRENKSNYLLRNAGIIGMAFSIIPVFTPVYYCLNCTSSELFRGHMYAFSIGLVTSIPMLVSSGVSLYLLGKRNVELYGKSLMATGILWSLAFLGNAIGLAIIAFRLWNLMILAVTSYCFLPASVLMMVHGVKLKDRYFVLAGIFYLVSLFLSIFFPWIIP